MSTMTTLSKAFSALGAVFGASIEMPTTYPPSKVIGTNGARTYGGTPANGEINRKLIGVQRYVTFDSTVANDIVVAVGVRLFLALLSGAKWSSVPAKPRAVEGGKGDAAEPTPKAQYYADRIRELVLTGTRTTWSTIIKWLGGFIHYDYRLSEVTLERREDGAWGVMDIGPRPNHTIEQWVVGEHGVVIGVIQRDPQTQEWNAIPRAKLVYLADNAVTSTPEGCGILRHAIETSTRVARLLDLEAIGYETTMEGMPIGRVPYLALKKLEAAGTIPGFKAASATAEIESMVQNKVVTRQRGLMLDSEPYRNANGDPTSIPQYSLDVVRGEAKGAADINVAIQRDRRYLAILFGVEHLVLGGDKGAFNLAEDKNDRQVALVNNVAFEIAAALKRDVVIPVMRANGWPIELAPDLVPSDITKLDPSVIATVLRDLGVAGDMLGVPSEDKAADEVRGLMGISPRPKYDPVAAAAAAAITRAPAPTDPNADPNAPPKPGAPAPKPAPKGADGKPLPAAAARAVSKYASAK